METNTNETEKHHFEQIPLFAHHFLVDVPMTSLISEASVGNIGKQLYNGHKSKHTYGDIVIAPTAGLGWMVGEDAIEVANRLLVKVLRSVMTLTHAFANILRGRVPWRRDYRIN